MYDNSSTKKNVQEPEIFQRLTGPPRNLSLSVYLLLLSNSGFSPVFGWFFACLGMIFTIVFLPIVWNSFLDLALPDSQPFDKGVIKFVEENPLTFNGIHVYHYHVELSNGTRVPCFTTGKKYEVNQTVDLVRVANRVKAADSRLTASGGDGLLLIFVLIFPSIGIGFILYGIFQGRKAIRLLQNGEVGKGQFVEISPTCMCVNNQSVMKLHYTFTASDGGTYNVYASLLYPQKLSDNSAEPVFYDPTEPTDAVLFNALPERIRFEELERTFRANPLRVAWQVALPLLSCCVFLGELAFLVYTLYIGEVV